MSWYSKYTRTGTTNRGQTVPLDPARGLIAPPSSGGTSPFTTAARQFGASMRGGAAPADVVVGPLDTYERDTGREFQGVGKFGVNLYGSSVGPNRATPYNLPEAQRPEQEVGFIEHLLGGLFGLSGNETARDVGAFLGSAFDLPLETVGNVAALPLSLGSGLSEWDPRNGGLRSEFLQVYENAVEENPVNALLWFGKVAKMQWEADHAAGRHTGLFAEFGPSTNLIEQLGTAVNLIVLPSAVLRRTTENLNPGVQRSIESLEQAYRSGRTSHITNDRYQFLLDRLERGDFGTPGTQSARDALRDAIAWENLGLNTADEDTQEGWATLQGARDFLYSLVTDPLLIGSFGSGILKNVTKGAASLTSNKFLSVFPVADRPAVAERMFDEAARIIGTTDVERAAVMMNADPQLRFRAMNAVVDRFPEYGPQAAQAREAASYLQNWALRWEPRLRPVIAANDWINNGFGLFGRGPSGEMANTIYARQTTEGYIRATAGLDGHANLMDELGALGDETARNFESGLGVASANFSRMILRDQIVSDVRRIGGVPFATTPDEIISLRALGARGADLATVAEQWLLRRRPLYLATERGGAEAAVARARDEAATRLTLMGASREDAVRIAGRLSTDEVAEIDMAYFGHAVDEFVRAKDAAVKAIPSGGLPKGALDPRRFTVLGPRQMTMQDAQAVLDSIKRGAVSEVREALIRYDVLFENFGEGMSDTDLLEAVRSVLDDFVEAKALPTAITDYSVLPDGVRAWANTNLDLGYRPGLMPDDVWRATVDDGKIVGISPWVEFTGQVADVGAYSRWARAKDRLFHHVRGERILADARIRMARHTSDAFGFTHAQSDALFARIIRMAEEGNITPRGMTPEQLIRLVKTHNLPEEISRGISKREIIEAVMTAFEGNFWKVGVTQKFTGGAKTALGGTGNWLGIMAERIYPMVRFVLNPLFQAQEMIEPFFLNTVRGIKPGFVPSELDEATLRVMDITLRQSRYALDDQIEHSNRLLWGNEAARNAFGPTSRMGRFVRAISLNGRLDVQRAKATNYARATRREMGREFAEGLNQVSPQTLIDLRAHYAEQGIFDDGEIAVRYFTEKAQWMDNGVEGMQAKMAALKPPTLGARTPVTLGDVVAHTEVPFEDGEALRRAVRSGEYSTDDLRTALMDAGAHPTYADGAVAVASMPFSPDEWWDGWQRTLGQGNSTATRRARALVQARASVLNMTEEEYLARRMADLPMGAEARELAAMSAAERRAFQFMVDATDESVGRRLPVSATIQRFREQTRFADRENFAVIDHDGNILAEAAGDPWRVMSSGAHAGASIDVPDEAWALARGNIMVHNHPSQNPYSPADLASATVQNVGEMVVVGPGVTYHLTPIEGNLSLREGVEAVYGGPMDEDEIANIIATEWRAYTREFYDSLRDSQPEVARLYGKDLYDAGMYAAHMDSISIQHALQRMSDRYGWRFDAVYDYSLPTDPVRLEEMLKGFADGAPVHLKAQFPYVYGSAPIARHDFGSGSQVAYEFAPGTGSRHEELFPQPYMLSDPEAARQIMDGIEDWLRAEVSPLLGVVATDVRRARGGWFDTTEGEFYDAANAVVDMMGSRSSVEDWARAVGYLMQQSEVIVTRPKIGAQAANYAAGEAWAFQFRANRELSDDEATRLLETISRSAPEIGNMGSMVVRLSDGRTAIRFVRRGDPADGLITRAQFDAMTQSMRTVELLDDVAKAAPDDVEVVMTADVMDTVFVGNNWTEAPNGSGYLEPLRERRAGLAEELERRLAGEATDRLAALYRQHAPDDFARHIESVRAAGKPVPEFHTPGQYVPAALGDRLSVFIPGGAWRLANDAAYGSDAFTLWEQQLLKVQKLDAERLWNSDPELAAALYSRIWNAKEKDLDFINHPEGVYNAFAWAALTANAALDVTEAAFPMLRASRGQGSRMPTYARQVAARLPKEYQDDAAAMGIAFQLHEGLRIDGFSAYRAGPGFTWTAEQREEVSRLASRLDNIMRRAPNQAARERTARRLNAALGGGSAARTGNGVSPQVHPFPTNMDMDFDFPTFVTIPRPNRMKGTGTNRAWGNVLNWLRSGLFTSDSPGVKRFMQQQSWESRSQYALRLSSILPGIDVKTSMLAASVLGPKQAGRAALDTHMLRYIATRAQARGEIDLLLADTSAGFRDHVKRELDRLAGGKSSSFRSPRTTRVWLLPERLRGLDPEGRPEIIETMRQNLTKIPDPEVRALYDDPEVLRFVARTGGKVNIWGGDYAVIDNYLNTTLRQEEADALRAAGHPRAAEFVERISAAEWQWLLWDRIRSSAGVRLDPHVGVSRGADILPHRSALELDTAVGLSRMPGPQEPFYSLSLMESDGHVLGANVLLEDERRILLATEHADARTGMHELAHVFEVDLDPSQREIVLAAYRAARGSERRTWSREVSEWWADEFLNYVRAGRQTNRSLHSSFEYLRRQMERAEEALRVESEARVLKTQRNRAVNTASRKVERASQPAKDADTVRRAAERRVYRAARDLRRAKARTGISELERRWGLAREETVLADTNLREAKAAVRAAQEEAKAAGVRARQAAGTRSAGGLTVAARRAEARIADAQQNVKAAQRALDRAKRAQARAGADVRGARKRTPVEKFEQEHRAARAELDRAAAKATKATEVLNAARKALDDAKALPLRPARATATRPVMSAEMRGLFDTILTPAKDTTPKTGPGSAVDIGTHFDLQQEAVYEAARQALRRAEENAFTLHYYRRGRSFLERSINHPYFGLYPASYMWGKILPEMIRFLVRTPFGIDAPLGGLALTHNIYRQMMVQQNFDLEFREQMADRQDFFHMLALLTPGLPWEVPVNAPLWARRVAEADAERQAKLAGGEKPEDTPMMDAEGFGRLTREMFNYAFGPAQTGDILASGISSLTGSLSEAAQTVQGILANGAPNGAPIEPAAPLLDTAPAVPAIVPPPEPEPVDEEAEAFES